MIKNKGIKKHYAVNIERLRRGQTEGFDPSSVFPPDNLKNSGI